eukprot:7724733-Alexandrium_andersonii.AAC.1
MRPPLSTLGVSGAGVAPSGDRIRGRPWGPAGPGDQVGQFMVGNFTHCSRRGSSEKQSSGRLRLSACACACARARARACACACARVCLGVR